MSNDKPILGIGFAATNAFFLSAMGLFAKLLSEFYGAIEVTFFRNLSSLIMLFIGLIFIRRLWHLLKTQRFKAQLFRATIGTIGVILGMWSYAILPMAEATILFFTCPLFIVILSHIFLKEQIGPFRIAAVAVGFIGVIVMSLDFSNSSAIQVTIPILGLSVGLAYAFVAAGVDVCLRWMGKTEHALTTTFYFLMLGALSTSLYWPFSKHSIDKAFHIEPALIMLGLGFCGLMSLILKTQSYRLAPATVIGPVIFTMIIWALVFDYIIWHRIPEWNALLGAGIIISSNLFIVWREKKKMKILQAHIKETL